MANKSISELTEAITVNNQDLFVLEQGGLAKKMTAETFITTQSLIDALASALDGHGGISSITLASLSGRIRTYRITFADGSATTFQVYDGTSIERITKTSSAGLVDTYTIFMNDGTTTYFTVSNGADGTVSEAMLNDALKDKAPAITETTESSAIANFTDGADNMVMHNIVAEINPVQDLTYGDPYPAGGGKNKLTVPNANFTINGIEFISSNGQITINGNNTAGAGVSSLNDNFKSNWSFSIQAGTYYFSRGSFGKATYLYHDVSGSAVALATNNGSFTLSEQDTVWVGFYVGASDSFNMVAPDIQLEVGSAKTSFEPVANICPIAGHTEVNVTRTGANVWDEEWRNGYYNSTTGVFTSYANQLANKNTISVLPNTTYYAKAPSATKLRLVFRDVNGSVLQITNAFNGGTFTTPNGCVGLDFNTYESGYGTTYNHDISINYPSTDTAYHAYAGSTTATLSWQTEAGTVYGGTIDVATGLLTVDCEFREFDGTENWAKSSSYDGSFYLNTQTAHNYNAPAVCSHAKYLLTFPSGYVFGKFGLDGAQRNIVNIWIAEAGTSLADFKAYLATQKANGTPLQCALYLTTKQTYQLSVQQLMTLLGTNNVWTDIGNVSVTYPADTKLYIEKLTQPTEDDLVANQAITSGKYFMIGNSLYLALANIASGAQITIGTNAQRVSLADALNTINS